MIHLFISDEIFVVVPPLTEPNISQEATIMLNNMTRCFNVAILDSLGKLTRSKEEDDSFVTKKKSHVISRYSRGSSIKIFI